MMVSSIRLGRCATAGLLLGALVSVSGCGMQWPAPIWPNVGGEQDQPAESVVVAEPAPAPAAEGRAEDHTRKALSLLESGQYGLARQEVQKALSLRPNAKLAGRLNKLLGLDAVAYFGKDSFPYTIQAGDSLSEVADLFFDDWLLFPLLAKYNGIKKPNGLKRGQTIRIPVKGAKQPQTEVAFVRPADESDGASAVESGANAAVTDAALEDVRVVNRGLIDAESTPTAVQGIAQDTTPGAPMPTDIEAMRPAATTPVAETEIVAEQIEGLEPTAAGDAQSDADLEARLNEESLARELEAIAAEDAFPPAGEQ